MSTWHSIPQDLNLNHWFEKHISLGSRGVAYVKDGELLKVSFWPWCLLLLSVVTVSAGLWIFKKDNQMTDCTAN